MIPSMVKDVSAMFVATEAVTVKIVKGKFSVKLTNDDFPIWTVRLLETLNTHRERR